MYIFAALALTVAPQDILLSLHVNIFLLHVDIIQSHVNIIISHVDKIYLARREQKYATIQTLLRLWQGNEKFEVASCRKY